MTARKALTAILLSAAATGCLGDSGARGRYGFSTGLATLLGGATQQPFAAGGASATIYYDRRPFAPDVTSARSSDPSVFRVETSDSVSAHIVTGHAGRADLVLLDASDHEVDRATFTVEDVDRITVHNGWGPGAGPTVLTWVGVTLDARVWHGAQPLEGRGTVRFTVEPPLYKGSGAGDSISVLSRTPGTARVTMESGAARTWVPVRSIDPGSLTRLELSTQSLHLVAGKEAPVEDSASADDQPIYNAACDWTSDPAGLAFRADGMVDATHWRTYVTASAPGTYRATCKLGPLQTSLTVVLDPR